MLSSAKSMGDDATRMEVLRDPKRIAALLIRAFSSSVMEDSTNAANRKREHQEENDEEVEETHEKFQDIRRQNGNDDAENMASLRLIIPHTTADDDDDDEKEEEEEEDEDAGLPLEEEELEAAATALQTASGILEDLRLKMMLKADQQMQRQQQQNEENDMSDGSVVTPPVEQQLAKSFSVRGKPGLPLPNAPMLYDSACNGCNKSFNPFQRSKNCGACGFTFCPKCSSNRMMLPLCFGYHDEAVRICDLCARWFQQALERCADVAKLTKNLYHDHDRVDEINPEDKIRAAFSSTSSPVLTANIADGTRATLVPPRPLISSPETVRAEENVDENVERCNYVTANCATSTSKYRHRHSSSITTAPSLSSNKNKPWFSGHLSAMHVSDRLPRKKISRGENENDAEDSSPEGRSLSRRASSKGRSIYDDCEGKEVTGKLGASAANTQQPLSLDYLPTGRTKEKDLERRKWRCSRFSRSASLDLTNLPSTASSSASPDLKRCNTFGPDDLRRVIDDMNGCSNARSNKKAFDDSDIVDARAQSDSGEGNTNIQYKVSAAVLRFAVYDMGGREGAGLRRTFGFSKANPVLDRYTLELDCRQRVVRAKSVFMHRFWSFHCDSVVSFISGSSEGMARLVIMNGGQANQSFELKFANDDEREQFKLTMDSCRLPVTSLDRIRTYASRSTTFSGNASTCIETDLGLMCDSVGNTAANSSTLQSLYVPLLPGEQVVPDIELEATLLVGPASETYDSALDWGRIRGKIAVTNYRVIFLPFERTRGSGGQTGIAYIPLFAITHVQLVYPYGRRARTYNTSVTGTTSIISISCKDIRIMRFQLDSHPSVTDKHTQRLRETIARMSDISQRYSVVETSATTAFASLPTVSSVGGDSEDSESIPHDTGEPGYLETMRSPGDAASSAIDRNIGISREVSGSFAFAYSIDGVPFDQNGWNIYLDESEFKRQIGGDPAVSPFLKFYKNDRGNICKSYPSKLLLPASVNSSTIAKVTAFRAKNRLPVITYYHRRNRCVLTRSSQPLLGNLLSISSNVSDQLLVGVYRRLPDILKNQSQSSTSSRPIYIFDARKAKASTGNRLMGKGGVETPQDYPGAVVHHLNIANMYRMQSSFMGLMKLFLPGGIDDADRTWLSSVESTRWLDHVRLVLDGALKIARVLELEGASALVHCSDGWDRTAQLCALAQLMIDPYYRTLTGFCCLVEKDWCSFGHKFAERTGGDRNRDPQRNKSSPVMFQFIDAVWQMQRQFPLSFQFNERFLLHLANALTSGLYGTFLFDSRFQRDVNNVKYNTVSVWTPVLMTPSLYTNNNYEQCNGPIWPWVSCKMMCLWENYFLQWHPRFYRCQWACSLVASYVPFNLHDSTNDTVDSEKRGTCSSTP